MVLLNWLGLFLEPGLPKGLGEFRNPGEWSGDRNPFTGELLIRNVDEVFSTGELFTLNPGEIFSTGELFTLNADEEVFSKDDVVVLKFGEDFSTGDLSGEANGLVPRNPNGLGLWELTGELTWCIVDELTLLNAEYLLLSVSRAKNIRRPNRRRSWTGG